MKKLFLVLLLVMFLACSMSYSKPKYKWGKFLNACEDEVMATTKKNNVPMHVADDINDWIFKGINIIRGMELDGLYKGAKKYEKIVKREVKVYCPKAVKKYWRKNK